MKNSILAVVSHAGCVLHGETMKKLFFLSCLFILSVPCAGQEAPPALAQSHWVGTVYYSPIVQRSNPALWKHGIGWAFEREFSSGWSIGPRFTLGGLNRGPWYGQHWLLGVHLSHHFHVNRTFIPHMHIEGGEMVEKLVAQKRNQHSAYFGVGGSLGWRVNSFLTVQVPQYTFFYAPSLVANPNPEFGPRGYKGRAIHLTAVGLSVHF